MPRSALRLTGLDQFRSWKQKVIPAAKSAMLAATEEALMMTEYWAQENLDAGIYNKEREPFATELTYELYNSWYQKGPRLIGLRVQASLANTSGHAGYIEFGTDDEGTGEHWVPVVTGKALHWIDPATGGDVFSQGHFVKGIKPLRFLERAVREHEVEIADIFRKHLSVALKGL